MATMPPPGETPPPPPTYGGTGAPPPPGGHLPPDGPAGAPLPWEDQRTPFWTALVETVKLFVTRPEEAYRRMAPQGPLGRPILYAVIIGWLGILVAQLYGLAMQGMLLGFLPHTGVMKSVGLPLFITFGSIVLAPVFIVIGLFIWTVIVHFFLMIFGGARGGFATTFRVLSYAATAQLAGLVPMVGGLVAMVWSVVLQVIGLAEAHGTSRGKAAAAVLLPWLICCTCLVVGLLFSGAALVNALSGAAHS